MTEQKEETREIINNTRKNELTKKQKWLIAAILLSAFTGIVIGMLRQQQMDGTALLYIGAPTFLALMFAGMPKSDKSTVMGATLKSITFVILISGPLLQEGFICMIMVAPIFYIVGALAAWPFDHYRKKKQRGQDASRLNMLVLPSILLVMSMEGVFEQTTFDRHNTVEYTKVVDGSIEQIKSRLSASRKITSPDSLFGKLFPRPERINANGLSKGGKQWLDVTYAKWIYWNKKKGQVQFEVVENRQGYIKFKPVIDSSYISNYLTWGDTEVFMVPLSDQQTRITWRISFSRDIDPAWYAGPLQRYAVKLAAKQLVESLQ